MRSERINMHMRNRLNRLLIIEKLIRQHRMSTQEELLSRLGQKGIKVTQATLSRDLKYLKISRTYDEHAQVYYTLPESAVSLPGGPEPQPSVNGLLGLGFSYRMALIKTLPGFASSIAMRIDRAGKRAILGTIAGDDTILVVPREGATRKDIITALKMIFPQATDVFK